MTGGLQCLADAGETSARHVFGECEHGQTMQMSDILTSLVEFALQILLRDQQVAQSHPNVLVAEQLHESQKANSEPKHFCGKAVPQPVWVHMSGATGALGGLV